MLNGKEGFNLYTSFSVRPMEMTFHQIYIPFRLSHFLLTLSLYFQKYIVLLSKGRNDVASVKWVIYKTIFLLWFSYWCDHREPERFIATKF